MNPAGTIAPRISADEGVDNAQGQVADLALVEANGRTYLYYTALSSQSASPAMLL